MNPPTTRRNPFSIFRTRSLDDKDVNLLMDALASAAILVYAPESKIFSWNSKALALTAYTHSELEGMSVQRLFPNYPVNNFEPSNHKVYVMELGCVSRIGTELPVTVTVHHFQPNSEWVLIQFEPSSVRNKRDQLQDLQTLQFDGFRRLARELLDSRNNLQIPRILEVIRDITTANQVAVYRADAQTPHMEYVGSLGETAWLPERVQASDVSRLPSSYLWQPGKRIRSVFHRLGRASQVAYVCSAVIGDENAISGLLICADSGAQPPDNLIDSMEFVATLLSSAMQQDAIYHNLKGVIQSQEERLSHLSLAVENMIEASILLDLDTSIIDVNHSFEEIFGYAKYEILGKPIEDVVIGAGNLMYAINTAINKIITPSLGETTLHRREGQAFPADVRVLPVLHEDLVKQILVVIRDKSEHKQFQFRAQQLEQRAFLGEVTAIFAHEVRNPINNISTALQLLSMNLKSDEKSMEVIERTKGDVERLTQLMKSILTFSKSSEYKLEPLDFKSYFERLIMRWKPRFDRENVKVTWHVSPRTPLVRANEHALEQVFTNLLNNSLRAMGSKGGSIVIKVGPKKAAGGTPTVQIDISDTGPGIPPEVLENIFNPFFSTDVQGTGLGLTITQRIILAHKGTITAESFLGEGTVFHINIPVFAEEEKSNGEKGIQEP